MNLSCYDCGQFGHVRSQCSRENDSDDDQGGNMLPTDQPKACVNATGEKEDESSSSNGEPTEDSRPSQEKNSNSSSWKSYFTGESTTPDSSF